MSEIDLGTLDSKGLEALAKRIAEAARAKKRDERKQVNLPDVVATLEYVGERPMVTVTFPLFAGPSVDNTYDKLIVGSSTNGNRKYVAVGALKGGEHDGKIVEVSFSARIPK